MFSCEVLISSMRFTESQNADTEEMPGVLPERKDYTLFLSTPSELEDRQEALSWEISREILFRPTKHGHPDLNKQKRERRRKNKKASTYQRRRARHGQIRERALWSSSAASHTQCKLGVSIQHATFVLFCFCKKEPHTGRPLFPLCICA